MSLKGIITVSPEDIHNHSVKQTGVRREESTFPFNSSWSSSLPVSSTQLLVGKAAVLLYSQPTRCNGTEGRKFQEYIAVFALVALDLSLPSMAGQAQGPLICAVGTLGCRLGRLAAGQCDCLIGGPLKAM